MGQLVATAADEIVLELELPDGVRKGAGRGRGRGLALVQRTSAAAEADAGPPSSSEDLAQSPSSELMWAVDTLSNGRQMLCITLPKKERGRLGAASADCIFDESLHTRRAMLAGRAHRATITLDSSAAEELRQMD